MRLETTSAWQGYIAMLLPGAISGTSIDIGEDIFCGEEISKASSNFLNERVH